MGYTHYFPQKREVTSEEWSRIVGFFGKIMKASSVPIVREYDEPGTEPKVTSDEIWFNGVGEDGHETMTLYRKHEGFVFCKTIRKPYDVVVGALLAVAAHVAPGAWDMGSDGDEHEDEWQAALDLARKAVGQVIEYPVVREEDRAAAAEEESVLKLVVRRGYVVRVALDEEQVEDQMIKGTVDFMAHAEFIQIHEDTDAALLFDIKPPAHVTDEDSRAWAEKVAEGMEANHYNAVVAPPWPEKSDG